MPADAVHQILIGVACWVQGVRVAKDRLIPVRRRPVQLYARSLWQRYVADRDRAGRDATIGQERAVDPQNLINDGVELGTRHAGAQLLLQRGVCRQVMNQYADTLRD